MDRGTGKGRLVAGVAAVSIVVVLVAAVLARLSPSVRYGRVDPPSPPRDGLEGAIARLIERSTDEVLAHPYSADAWGALGASYDVHDLFPEAIVCYGRAETLDPDNPHWPYFLGFCHEDADPAAAVDAWLRAEAVMPDYVALQVRLGRARLALGEPGAAAGHFERALQVDGGSIPAHIGLARVALAGGDATAALGHLDHAAKLGPRSGQVDQLRAEAYRLAGQPQASARHATLARGREGIEPLADAIRADVGREYGVSMGWRRIRSDTYLRAGMVDQAVAEWEAAVLDDPESAEANGQLGLVYARAGRMDEAIAALEKAIELDPYEHSVRSNLGGLLINQGRSEEGIEYMRQACRFLPDSADAHFNLGVALRTVGRGDEAVQALEKACLLEPKHARAQFERGTLLVEQRRFDEAVEALRLAVAAAPEQRSLQLVFSNALYLGGQAAESIAVLRAAVGSFPDDAALVRQLAWRLATSADDALVDGEAAFGLIEPICRSNGFGNPIQLDALAAACAARGDFEGAIRHAQRAKALVTDPAVPLEAEARTRMVRMLDGRLDDFRNGRRVRDPIPGAR